MGILRELSAEDFDRDPHAAKYRGEIDAHPEAFNRLFALLNDYDNKHHLTGAEIYGFPALSGVVRFIETDPAIVRVLEAGQDGCRFRQAVKVAIRLKMEKIGWTKRERKALSMGLATSLRPSAISRSHRLIRKSIKSEHWQLLKL